VKPPGDVRVRSFLCFLYPPSKHHLHIFFCLFAMFPRSFLLACCLSLFLILILINANEQKLKFRSGTKAALSSSTSRPHQKSLSNGDRTLFSFPFSRTDSNAIILNKSKTLGEDNSNKKNLKKSERQVKDNSQSNIILSTFYSAKREILLYKNNILAAEDNYERLGVTVDTLLRNRVALAITTIGVIGTITKLLPPNPQK
jgi:hypothetical protein